MVTIMTDEQIADGWKAANIARVKMEMKRYNLTVADLIDPGDNQPMVALLEPQPRTSRSGNTVAGE